jgi:hypothetical protein
VNLVIPVAVECVPLDTEFGHFGVTDLATFFVRILIEPGVDLQSLLRACRADQVVDDLQRFQWYSLPIAGDMTEQAVLDLVPLAGTGGIMAHLDDQAGLVGEPLELEEVGNRVENASELVAEVWSGSWQTGGPVLGDDL